MLVVNLVGRLTHSANFVRRLNLQLRPMTLVALVVFLVLDSEFSVVNLAVGRHEKCAADGSQFRIRRFTRG